MINSNNQRILFCLLGILFIGLSIGCTPSIGDECQTLDDCPAGAICDNTVANGYCTVEDCRSGGCPENSVCIEFDDETSYCMKACGSKEDCRDGHSCRNRVGDTPTDKFCYVE